MIIISWSDSESFIDVLLLIDAAARRYIRSPLNFFHWGYSALKLLNEWLVHNDWWALRGWHRYGFAGLQTSFAACRISTGSDNFIVVHTDTQSSKSNRLQDGGSSRQKPQPWDWVPQQKHAWGSGPTTSETQTIACEEIILPGVSTKTD